MATRTTAPAPGQRHVNFNDISRTCVPNGALPSRFQPVGPCPQAMQMMYAIAAGHT